MEYLLDTDWAIDYLHKAERTHRRLDELFTDGVGIERYLASRTLRGSGRLQETLTPDAEALGLFLEAVDVVPLDDAACRVFGQERARLREGGNLIGDLDILIGATAISCNLTLLTNNRRHFERMQGLNIVSA